MRILINWNSWSREIYFQRDIGTYCQTKKKMGVKKKWKCFFLANVCTAFDRFAGRSICHKEFQKEKSSFLELEDLNWDWRTHNQFFLSGYFSLGTREGSIWKTMHARLGIIFSVNPKKNKLKRILQILTQLTSNFVFCFFLIRDKSKCANVCVRESCWCKLTQTNCELSDKLNYSFDVVQNSGWKMMNKGQNIQHWIYSVGIQ